MKAQRQAGFTIIEVLIVLAVAGMIMLLVFLAIPALQRNSRNNQRKQDVAAILAAISHHELNNSGNLPGDCTFLQFTKLTFYESANTCGGSSGSGALSPTNTFIQKGPQPDSELVEVHNYQRCDPNNPGVSNNTGAGYYDVAALYALESGSGTTPQCQQL